jgi:hypothetical protein
MGGGGHITGLEYNMERGYGGGKKLEAPYTKAQQGLPKFHGCCAFPYQLVDDFFITFR